MKNVNLELNPNTKADAISSFEASLRSQMVAQDEAVDAVVDIYQQYLAGFKRPGHTVGNLMFLGPTGTGKTNLVEAVANTLHHDRRAMIKVDCGEFQHSHQTERLLGSPPGYLGHNETLPVFSQANLDRYNATSPLSVVLFDEIEKAHDAMTKLILGILDKATLSLGNNRVTDFSNTMLFLTSNVGASELDDLVNERFGFGQVVKTDVNYKNMKTVATSAAKRKFSPEFINRLDKIVVFHTLNRSHIEKILEIELGAIQTRLLDTKAPFIVNVTGKAKETIIEQSYDAKMNARPLKRTLEENIVRPLATLVTTEQVKHQDFIMIDHDGDKFRYIKRREGCIIPPKIIYGAEPVKARKAATADKQQMDMPFNGLMNTPWGG